MIYTWQRPFFKIRSEVTASPPFLETAKKELQDISCRESGGVPQLLQSPKIGGYGGLIETISAIYFDIVRLQMIKEVKRA